MKIPRLNIGCGFNYDSNFINIDFDDKEIKVDRKINLENAFLQDIQSNSIELIRAFHILEHINNFIPLMKELHRVLKHDGILHIRVPEFPCRASVSDPTHVRYFVPESFYHWTDMIPGGRDTGETGNLFKMEWMESIVRDSGIIDNDIPGSWFTELEIELKAVKRHEKAEG